MTVVINGDYIACVPSCCSGIVFVGIHGGDDGVEADSGNGGCDGPGTDQ